jgi:SAM-dependent methyltransferase
MMMNAQADIYSTTDYHKQKHGASQGALDLIGRYRTKKFQAFLRDKNRAVLEIGVGPGWNLTGLDAARRVGMDVTRQYADHLKNQGVEFVSDMSELSGQEFDLIILSHVMEHLADPVEKLAEIRSLLKKDGKLLIIVPLEPAVRKVSPKDKNYHLFSWNVQTLHNLLASCKYSVHSCAVKSTGYDRYAAELAIQLRGGFGLYRLMLSMIRTIRPEYEIQILADSKK